MKEHDGKQVTHVQGPFPKEYTQEEMDAVKIVMTETGKAPNRKWRRFYERWKARQEKK